MTAEDVVKQHKAVALVFWLRHGRDPVAGDEEDFERLEEIIRWAHDGGPFPWEGSDEAAERVAVADGLRELGL